MRTSDIIKQVTSSIVHAGSSRKGRAGVNDVDGVIHVRISCPNKHRMLTQADTKLRTRIIEVLRIGRIIHYGFLFITEEKKIIRKKKVQH